MTVKNFLFPLLMLSAIAVDSPVAAQSSPLVAQARASGQVGERFDGYLGFATTPSETLRKQVNAINIRRRALYLDLARRKGVTSEEVGITAGCSTLARVAVGEAFLLGQGGWQRRNPGQSAPRPNYCGG